MTDTTKNFGARKARRSTTGYYLTRDASKSGDDQLIGRRSVGALAPKKKSIGSTTVIVPAGTASGDYLLLACADDLTQRREKNESNNCRASTARISVAGTSTGETGVTGTSTREPQQAIVVSGDSVSLGEGSQAELQVRLEHRPSSTVTVDLTSSDPDAGTVTPGTLAFTPANYTTPQQVTVAGVQDNDLANESVTITVSSPGMTSRIVTASIDDDDTQTIVVRGPSTVEVAEGQTLSLSVHFTHQPNGNATVTASSGDSTSISVSPSTASFTPANYATDQTFSLSGVQDVDKVNETVTVTYSAYGVNPTTITVKVIDDDLASKILLYGDSLTQEENADWTWRYRLWQSLTKSGHAFDFVGPRTDLYEHTTHAFDSQGYRNPNFDRDHAAIAGMRLLNGYYTPDHLTQTYQPDVIVAFIGFNDLYDTTVADLETEWRKQIAEARLNDVGVDFVIVPIPQTWWGNPGTGYHPITHYNTMINDVAASMDTPNERVLIAPLADLDEQTDTNDGLHLSASGELKVAAVVSEALAVLSIGDGLPVTSSDPPDDHTWAPQPAATVDGTTISVSWPAVTYASAQNMWLRDRTTGVVQVQRVVSGETATISGDAGRSYDLWLEPVKVYVPIGTTSNTIRVDLPAG